MIIQFDPFEPDKSDVGSNRGTGGSTMSSEVTENLVPTQTGYRTYPQWAASVSSGTVDDHTDIRGAYSASYNGSAYDFAGDAAKLYYTTTSAIADKSKVGGYSLASGDFWEFAQYGRYVIAASGGNSSADNLQVFDLEATAVFADLAGSPPKAKTIATVGEFLVVGHTYDATDGERPNRVRWSAIGDHTDWTVSAVTQSDFQDLKSSAGTVQKIVGGSDAFIVCESGVYLMTLAQSSLVFRFDLIHPGVGTDFPQSVVRQGSYCYFYARGGFVRVGTTPGDIAWIGAGRVDQFFAQKISASYPSNYAQGCIDLQNQSIRWGGQGNGARALCYSFAFDKWWISQNTLGVQFVYQSNLKVGDWRPAGSPAGYGTTEYLYSQSEDTDCELWKAGTNFLQLNEGRRSLVTRVRPIYEHDLGHGTATLTVYTYNDPINNLGFSLITGTTYAINTSLGHFDLIEEGRYLRFVLAATVTGEKMEPYGLDIESTVAGGVF